MTDVVEIFNVSKNDLKGIHNGQLSFDNNCIVFNDGKTGKKENLSVQKIDCVYWMRRLINFGIKITTLDKITVKYDGFIDKDFDMLSSMLDKKYNLKLKKKDTSIKGWNCGKFELNDDSAEFYVDNKHALDIPLEFVSHVNKMKNELTLEFHKNTDLGACLSEIRFCLSKNDDDENDRLEQVYDKINNTLHIDKSTSQLLLEIPDVQVSTPRGRYDMKIHLDFMHFHGKSINYKLSFSNITRMFLLPHNNEKRKYFVIGVNSPVKLGQMRYYYVVLVFMMEEEESITLDLSEDALSSQFNDSLTKVMEGYMFDIIGRIMMALVQKKITVPGSFNSSVNSKFINCSYKATVGLFYPLERAFIFITKQVIFVRYEEISIIKFVRASTDTLTKYFDLNIITKAGVSYSFGGINKYDKSPLEEFWEGKHIKVVLEQDKFKIKPTYAESSEDESINMNTAEFGDETSDSSFEYHSDSSDIREEYESEVYNTSDGSNVVYSDASVRSDDKSDKEIDGEASPEIQPKKKRKLIESQEKPKKLKKTKKPVDKDRPKRPCTSYIYFVNDKRQEIKNKYENISVIDVSRKAGEMWKQCTNSDKEKYVEMAAKDKARYIADMKIYNDKMKDNPAKNDKQDSFKTKSPKKAIQSQENISDDISLSSIDD
ncbi:FACT complex subunit POB3 [Intoshia linei]|uniref:FACT complex subunit SSRP1 n=1 Tax=Intoshia linei TaxID=1819745 RepID=A0A177BD95_9BILA|nr:FACT complex subunit POB3 [Intoshia linei]